MADLNHKSAKKRGQEDSPSFTPLSTQMGQGGGYKNGCPAQDLATNMGQGSQGHHSMSKDRPPFLRTLMGQG